MISFADLKIDALVAGKTIKLSFDDLDYYTLYRLFKQLQAVFGDGEFLYEQLYDTDLSYFKEKLRGGLIQKLKNNNVFTLGQLLDLSEKQLIGLKGVGNKSRSVIVYFLKDFFRNI